MVAPSNNWLMDLPEILLVRIKVIISRSLVTIIRLALFSRWWMCLWWEIQAPWLEHGKRASKRCFLLEPLKQIQVSIKRYITEHEWVKIGYHPTYYHFLSPIITYYHLLSLAITYYHLLSLAITYDHLLSFTITCYHLLSLTITCYHLLSHTITYILSFWFSQIIVCSIPSGNLT